MRSALLVSAASAVLLCSLGCGGSGNADRTSENRGGIEEPGQTEIYLRLDHPADSTKAKVGDKVSARLQSPVVAGGKDVVPNGTKFELRVTNSQVAKNPGEVGLLTFELDSFTLNARTYAIKALPVTAETAPLQSSVNEKAQTPHLPLPENQARTNAKVNVDQVLQFVTTQPFTM